MGIRLRDSFGKMAAAALVSSAALSSPVFAQIVETNPAPQTITATAPNAVTLSNISWHEPLVPYPAIAGLGLLFAAAAALGFRKKISGTVLRTGAGAVLLATIANPLNVKELREGLPTDVIVIVDQSPSQGIGERRMDADKAYKDLERQLNENGNIKIHRRDAGETKAGAVADGTNLFSALNEELTKVPRDRLGAIYIITDGQVHDVPEGKTTLGPNIPVHGLITGRQGEFDRRIVIDKAPQYGVVNEEETISFHVADDGATKGAQVRVSISIDGEEKLSTTVTAGQITDVKLKIPHVGVNTIQLKTDPVAGEMSALNNTVATEIRGKAKELNVLIVSGAPSAGLRLLREMFKGDPDNTVVHFTTIKNLMSEDETSPEELNTTALPMDEIFVNNSKKYDLIVMDHYSTGGLPAAYFENIAANTREGGSLIVLNGPEYAGDKSVFRSDIGELLPVVPDGTVTNQPYVPKLTQNGTRHPVTRGLPTDKPWGHWYSMPNGQRRDGYVLMEGAAQKPLVVLARQGKGRVATIMSDQVWLWAAGHDGGGPFAPLLTNISRWMLKNPAMEEEALRLSVSKDDNHLIVEQQTMADKNSAVMLRSPSGKTTAVNFEAAGPGLWRASIAVEEPGLYTATQAGKPPVVLNIGQANPKEFSSIVATPDRLSPFAQASGGSVRYLHDVSGAFVMPKITTLQADQNDKPAAGADFAAVRMTSASELREITRTGIPPWLAGGLIFSMLFFAYRSEGGKKKAPPQTGITKNSDGPSL